MDYLALTTWTFPGGIFLDTGQIAGFGEKYRLGNSRKTFFVLEAGGFVRSRLGTENTAIPNRPTKGMARNGLPERGGYGHGVHHCFEVSFLDKE
jgi:hypothetical protein